MIYVVDQTSASSHSSVAAFDLSGNEQGSAHLSDIMPPSPSGRFAESLQEDGSGSWKVYEFNLRVLLSFNCDRPRCKQGDRDTQHWNPKLNDQMIALRTGGAFGKGGACDVYQLSPAHLLKTVRCVGLPVYDWSRDGREIVTLEYEGGRLRREPVN
ncbi:MAG TPA: hypothetical protein VHW24_27440 [Bryobacteraceae bacterium]|nr:hypothetical protein [Bryobacteraceae bacterium]